MTDAHPLEGALSLAQAPERRLIDRSKVAYQLPQPKGMLADTIVASRT